MQELPHGECKAPSSAEPERGRLWETKSRKGKESLERGRRMRGWGASHGLRYHGLCFTITSSCICCPFPVYSLKFKGLV